MTRPDPKSVAPLLSKCFRLFDGKRGVVVIEVIIAMLVYVAAKSTHTEDEATKFIESVAETALDDLRVSYGATR